jgi:hypothetical protein
LEHQEEVVYLEALLHLEAVACRRVGVAAFHQKGEAYRQVGVAAFHQVAMEALHHREVEA